MIGERYSAAVCMKGHFVNSALEYNRADVASFCRQCGAPVIRACPHCSCEIGGGYRDAIFNPKQPDPFCSHCGIPYPWADREAIVNHLQNLLLYNDNLDQAQQLEVIEKLAILSTPNESERDRVDAGRKIMTLVPKAWAVAVPVLQSVLTAELKTKLGLSPA